MKYAPTAESPREYAEKKLGRGLLVKDTIDPIVFAQMEAFEAGQNSQIALMLPMLKRCRALIAANRKSSLRDLICRYIEDGERYSAG